MSVKKVDIANGVQGYYIKNTRFNTTFITYNFYLPLQSETMAVDALLPFLLTSCSKQFKDYIDLNIALLKLYGADLSCSVSKCGDCFHTKIGINVINDDLAFDNDRPVISAAELISGLIFAPKLENDGFCPEDIAREKRKTIERIIGEINNKKAFAKTRLFEEMFGEDPYGKFIYGSAKEVEEITEKQLFTAWQTLLSTAFVRINVIGKENPDTVFSTAKEYFEKIDRRCVADISQVSDIMSTNEVKDITERMKVTQGKLAMGFTSALKGDLKTAAALSLFSDIFGGGPYSKLFTNVREKQSLCYYCSASSRRAKGFLTVESGVEEENVEKTINAVLSELQDMKAGKFDDNVIEASKKAITDSLYSYYDNAAAIDIWYSREIGEDISPRQAAEIVMKVSREDIINAAKGIKLHTVYRLLPKEDRE